jgi:F0F1-type ATP synthase gamma subunit
VAYASGQFDTLTEPASFTVRHLNNLNRSGDPDIIKAFQDRANATNRRFNRLTKTFASQKDRVKQLQAALTHGPSASLTDALKLEGLETDLLNMAIELYGNETLTKRETEAATSLSNRLSMATWGSYGMRSNPTGTMVKQLDIVTARLPSIENELLEIVQGIDALMRANVDAGGPYLESGLNQSLNLQ